MYRPRRIELKEILVPLKLFIKYSQIHYNKVNLKVLHHYRINDDLLKLIQVNTTVILRNFNITIH